jgi:hypothetical protein
LVAEGEYLEVNPESINFVSIATNNYLDFWKKQALSLDKFLGSDSTAKLYLFTDQVDAARSFSKQFEKLSIEIFEIPNYGWPEATLLRFEILENSPIDWGTNDVFIYLDADMEAVDTITPSDFIDTEIDAMTLVRHPGPYRPCGIELLVLYASHPFVLLIDLISLIRKGGLGAWEAGKASKAYVPRAQRTSYYCGAIWWGRGQRFLELISSLSIRTSQDSANGVMARWHDESHLNWWATVNSHNVKSPAFCFASNFPWLSGVKPIIMAVDKGPFVRLSTSINQ